MRWLVLGYLCCLYHGALVAQQANTGCKTEVYLLKKTYIPTADIDDPIGYFMPAKADLAAQPLVADDEILGYDVQRDSTKPYYFDLSKSARDRVDSVVKKIPLYGQAFAIVVNGEPVFGGYFWSPASSYVCSWVTGFAVSDRLTIYPGYSDQEYADPRLNNLLVDCMKQSRRWRVY